MSSLRFAHVPNLENVSTLLETLSSKGLHLAIAESLTGGLLTSTLVDIPGSSRVLLGSIVAYQTELKHELLGVSKALLERLGPVDSQVAVQMAVGIRESMAAKCSIDPAKVIGVGTTGVAGPGDQDGHVAGTAFVAISSVLGDFVYPLNLTGNRAEVRVGVVAAAIAALGEHFG